MDLPELAQVVDPVSSYFEMVANPEIQGCGMHPQRLVFNYMVSTEREAAFERVVEILLRAVSNFEFKSPLYVSVVKAARLRDGGLDWGEWWVQFQINEHGRNESEIRSLVIQQVGELLDALEQSLQMH